MSEVVITHYKRSPFHFARKGGLIKVRPDEMAGEVIRDLVEQSGISAEHFEDLIVGCAFPEGEQGMNVARIINFLAKNLPINTAGATVNRFCGSSMQSIHMAAGAIKMGAGDAFICAGVESMTRVPMMGYNPLPHPALLSEHPEVYISMGETAENVAQRYKLTREEQDAFALRSQQKATAAQQAGKLSDEIVPIAGISEDGCIRGDSTSEGLAGLSPAFLVDGSVTAGTSSPLTDGASAVIVTSEEFAKEHNLKPIARIKSIAVAGCAPEVMGLGPVNATRKALSRAGLTIDDIDVIELNEAFASQALACIRDLKIDEEKVNLDGGAIALGHPLGATGARITGKAAQLMQREGKQFSLSTQCIGGGQGIATVMEAV